LNVHLYKTREICWNELVSKLGWIPRKILISRRNFELYSKALLEIQFFMLIILTKILGSETSYNDIYGCISQIDHFSEFTLLKILLFDNPLTKEHIHHHDETRHHSWNSTKSTLTPRRLLAFQKNHFEPKFGLKSNCDFIKIRT